MLSWISKFIVLLLSDWFRGGCRAFRDDAFDDSKSYASSLFNVFLSTSSLAWTDLKGRSSLTNETFVSLCRSKPVWFSFICGTQKGNFEEHNGYFFPCNYNEYELLLSSFDKGLKGTIKDSKSGPYNSYTIFQVFWSFVRGIEQNLSRYSIIIFQKSQIHE